MMQTFRWLRVPGDTLFALGAIALIIFVPSIRRPKQKTSKSSKTVSIMGDPKKTGGSLEQNGKKDGIPARNVHRGSDAFAVTDAAETIV